MLVELHLGAREAARGGCSWLKERILLQGADVQGGTSALLEHRKGRDEAVLSVGCPAAGSDTDNIAAGHP